MVKHSEHPSSIVREYDEFSKYYSVIERRRNELNGMIERIEGDTSTDIAPTLEELVSTHNLTLCSINNHKKSIRDIWEVFYPDRPFPRE